MSKKYYMIDKRNRRVSTEMKEYTLEELKEYFTYDDGEISNVERMTEVKDIDDLMELLEEEAAGMAVPYAFTEVNKIKQLAKDLDQAIIEARKKGVEVNKLKMYREQAGLSQAQLADASGVNKRMLQYYEQGARDLNKTQAGTLLKLAKALGCHMEDLIGEE